jgi:hypothetical protein
VTGIGPGEPASEVLSWRKIAIALIEAEKGEVKAQACDKAWLQQSSFRVEDSVLT